MSGFLKRNKTENPAGGVNPASSPNVGQYGWTSYDAANVNQLIVYVNMAKESATYAKEAAEYIAGKLGDVEELMVYTRNFPYEANEAFSKLERIQKDVTEKHSDVLTAHSNILQVYNDTVDMKRQAEEAAAKSIELRDTLILALEEIQVQRVQINELKEKLNEFILE